MLVLLYIHSRYWNTMHTFSYYITYSGFKIPRSTFLFFCWYEIRFFFRFCRRESFYETVFRTLHMDKIALIKRLANGGAIEGFLRLCVFNRSGGKLRHHIPTKTHGVCFVALMSIKKRKSHRTSSFLCLCLHSFLTIQCTTCL